MKNTNETTQTGYKIKQLEWEGLNGTGGQYNYTIAPPDHTKGWRVWVKIIDKYASIGGKIVTLSAADESEAKAIAQADFERRMLQGLELVNDGTLSNEGTESVNTLSAPEAVYGLLSWLTSREETVVLGARYDSSIGAELAKAFCSTNNLGMCRESFPKYLKHPSTKVSQSADIAEFLNSMALLIEGRSTASNSNFIKSLVGKSENEIAEIITEHDKALGAKIRALA